MKPCGSDPPDRSDQGEQGQQERTRLGDGSVEVSGHLAGGEHVVVDRHFIDPPRIVVAVERIGADGDLGVVVENCRARASHGLQPTVDVELQAVGCIAALTRGHEMVPLAVIEHGRSVQRTAVASVGVAVEERCMIAEDCQDEIIGRPPNVRPDQAITRIGLGARRALGRGLDPQFEGEIGSRLVGHRDVVVGSVEGDGRIVVAQQGALLADGRAVDVRARGEGHLVLCRQTVARLAETVVMRGGVGQDHRRIVADELGIGEVAAACPCDHEPLDDRKG
jgi:hypothetical protein